MNKIKRILTLLLCLTLVVNVASVFAKATDEAKITVQDVSTYVNSAFYVNVFAENLNDVATLDLELFYDAEVLTLQDVSVGSLVADAITSTNSDVLGEIAFSMATTSSISGGGTVLSLYFTVNSNATAQNTKVDIAIGEAYSSSLSSIEISGESGNIEILDYDGTTNTFYLSANVTCSDLFLNDIATVTVFNSNYYNFASADFIFEYDPSYFEVSSVTLSAPLLNEGAVYSCNTDISGLIKISYASTNEVYTSELFTVKLKMIKETEFSSTTDVWYSCQNVATSDLYIYQGYQSTTSFNIKGVGGSVYLDSTDFVKGLTAQSVVKLSADTNVAAADFVISYDISALKPISVTINSNATVNGGMVVINPNFTNGQIKFSYINEEGLIKPVSLINIEWEVLSDGDHTIITPSATSLVDVNFNSINLKFVNSENCIYSFETENIDVSIHPHKVVCVCNQCKKETNTFVSANGCLKCELEVSNYSTDALIVTNYSGESQDVSIPRILDGKTVIEIGDESFKNNTEIQTVTLPDTIAEIGSAAFSGCTSLSKITIYNPVVTIGESAFQNCSSNLVIRCEENSTAHKYALANNIAVELIGIKSIIENSVIDCENRVVFAEDMLYTDIESVISSSTTATITATPVVTYNQISYYGTGSKITVYDNDILLGEYTVIVKGDVNGDSICDVLDCMFVELARTNNLTPTKIQIYAANGLISNTITENSFQFVVNEAIN